MAELKILIFATLNSGASARRGHLSIRTLNKSTTRPKIPALRSVSSYVTNPLDEIFHLRFPPEEKVRFANKRCRIDTGALTSHYHQNRLCLGIIIRHQYNPVCHFFFQRGNPFHPVVAGGAPPAVLHAQPQRFQPSSIPANFLATFCFWVMFTCREIMIR